MDRFDRLGILIHNIGGSAARGGGALALSDDDWQQASDMNLFAAVRLDRAFLPQMLKQGSGVIIHISSIQRTLPLYDSTLAYAAAKAALTNYSKGLLDNAAWIHLEAFRSEGRTSLRKLLNWWPSWHPIALHQ